jgi:hypothetical protein
MTTYIKGNRVWHTAGEAGNDKQFGYKIIKTPCCGGQVHARARQAAAPTDADPVCTAKATAAAALAASAPAKAAKAKSKS